ncbi:MAG: hypothetical protein HY321_19155 [Armatimonadetes bacterium]|nr:hypothetical protein [Armatimonadota bacterium]
MLRTVGSDGTRARIWFGELPDVGYEGIGAVERTLDPARPVLREERRSAIEYKAIREPRTIYALLGREFSPRDTGPLCIRAAVSDAEGRGVPWSLVYGHDDVRVGLIEPHAQAVVKGALGASDLRELGPGALCFAWAAHGAIGSSESLFSHLGAVAVGLLRPGVDALPDRELLSLVQYRPRYVFDPTTAHWAGTVRDGGPVRYVSRVFGLYMPLTDLVQQLLRSGLGWCWCSSAPPQRRRRRRMVVPSRDREWTVLTAGNQSLFIEDYADRPIGGIDRHIITIGAQEAAIPDLLDEAKRRTAVQAFASECAGPVDVVLVRTEEGADVVWVARHPREAITGLVRSVGIDPERTAVRLARQPRWLSRQVPAECSLEGEFGLPRTRASWLARMRGWIHRP